jgi:hypothetical protein
MALDGQDQNVPDRSGIVLPEKYGTEYAIATV